MDKPNKISDEYLTLLRNSHQQCAAVAATKSFLETNMRMIYQLEPGDEIDTVTGEITRASVGTSKADDHE